MKHLTFAWIRRFVLAWLVVMCVTTDAHALIFPWAVLDDLVKAGKIARGANRGIKVAFAAKNLEKAVHMSMAKNRIQIAVKDSEELFSSTPGNINLVFQNLSKRSPDTTILIDKSLFTDLKNTPLRLENAKDVRIVIHSELDPLRVKVAPSIGNERVLELREGIFVRLSPEDCDVPSHLSSLVDLIGSLEKAVAMPLNPAAIQTNINNYEHAVLVAKAKQEKTYKTFFEVLTSGLDLIDIACKANKGSNKLKLSAYDKRKQSMSGEEHLLSFIGKKVGDIEVEIDSRPIVSNSPSPSPSNSTAKRTSSCSPGLFLGLIVILVMQTLSRPENIG